MKYQMKKYYGVTYVIKMLLKLLFIFLMTVLHITLLDNILLMYLKKLNKESKF